MDRNQPITTYRCDLLNPLKKAERGLLEQGITKAKRLTFQLNF